MAYNIKTFVIVIMLLRKKTSNTLLNVALHCSSRFWSELRWNLPELRVRSGQKPSTKIIYNLSQASVRLWYISLYKKNKFLATPNV